MTIKALFLDFYGTVVHEDDNIIPQICAQIQQDAEIECTLDEIGKRWWQIFSQMIHDSYGAKFETQRTIGLTSLHETITYFKSKAVALKIIEHQFNHWQKPEIFKDSKPFLDALEIPVYILSNIDTADVKAAIEHHNIHVDGVLTSEDVRSYKPRSEIFIEALRRFNLTNNEVIHIGDSLTSDVAGAQKAGLQAMWLNRKRKKKPEDMHPDFIAINLLEVTSLIHNKKGHR